MSFLFAHRRGYGVAPAAGAATLPPSADGESPAEVQRKTSRPERANPPAAVRAPRWVGAEKEPPIRGEHANAVRAPRLSGAEKEPPRQGEPACGSSSTPVRRGRKRCRPLGSNPPAAVHVPRSADAGKRRIQPAIKIFKKICVTLLQNTRK